MPRVRFTLPQFKVFPDTRPSACPRCGSVRLNRHGPVTKPISALYVSEVAARRYRCCDCGRAFRHYPRGVDHHDRSHRLRTLAALSWALGLSLRSVSHPLGALGCGLSRMSVWRGAQQAGTSALDGWLNRVRGRIRVMGADETALKARGRRTVVGFVPDAANGRLLGMDVLVERDSAGFVKWLRRYVSRFGVESMVTDGLNTYKLVAERLGVDRLGVDCQVCIAHVGKWVWNRLKEIEVWDWHRSRIWLLMTELPQGGGRELLEMEPMVRRQPKLHRLVVELCEKRRSLACRQRMRGMPQTNNSTERTIGRSKACAGLDPVSGTGR